MNKKKTDVLKKEVVMPILYNIKHDAEIGEKKIYKPKSRRSISRKPKRQ